MKKGYITVFFALVFTVIMSFVLSVFQGVRINAVRLKAECAVSVAENAVLSEYQPELLEMFDLFYVDTSYKSGNPDYHQVENHLWKYIEKNEKTGLASVEVFEITMATDSRGVPFRKQISDYMEDKIGFSYVQELTGLFQTVSREGFLKDDLVVENRVDETWQNALTKSSEIPEKTWKKVEKIYPVDKSGSVRNSFLLHQVINDKTVISKKSVDVKSLVSNRECVVGTGTEDKLTFTDKIYFVGYVFDKFSYYKGEIAENPLDYEIEYLISGKNNDYDNLSAVASKLLLIKEGINLAYLMTDSEKMSLIKDISAVLAALVVCPELEPVLNVVFVGLWSYAESVSDVKILLNGGKVPLMKTKESWNTDLDSGFGIVERNNKQDQKGMDYKQYLEMLLMFSNNEKLTFRCMDLMEMHIRRIKGNEEFRMDGCAGDFKINVVFEIPWFGSYQMVRRFGFFS